MAAATSVSFYTLGCKLNFSETSTIARQFAERGFVRREFYEPADVYVINTCSVTDNADKKCRKVVQQALKKNPQAAIVVVGCYAQLKPQEIADIPGVTAVLGAAEKFNLFEHISDFAAARRGQVFHGPIGDVNTFTPTWSLEERTRAFLKVQDGCDYKCSFCTIPLARGASRSNTIDSVVDTARTLTAQGIQEIVISGINLGDYGANMDWDGSPKLVHLLRALDEAPGVAPRLRVSSIEPNLLGNDIIAFVASSRRFQPHFHVPLQSGNNIVLAAMRRRYKRELYADRVAAIKAAMPHAAIGVDVIVGFPGETDAHFLDTYKFLTDLDVSYLHVFPYSERANTLAAELPDAVPQAVRNERSEMLRQLSVKKRRYFYEQHVGTTRPVLWEEAPRKTDKGLVMMEGLTDNYIRVSTPYDPLLANEIVPVCLASINDAGDVVAQLQQEVLQQPV
jgi:threonylcarbamoyladenosine tRNA methylthiotransferase MtaB